MAKSMGGNRLGVFDLGNNTFKVLEHHGEMWIDTTGEYEVLGDNLAFRYTPIKEKLSASYTILNTGETTGPNQAVILIPPDTYGQKLENRSFPNGGILTQDSLGNEYLKLDILEIVNGETSIQTFFTADLTRWLVYFNLEKIGNVNRIEIPEDFLIYTKDEDIYGLDEKIVKDLYSTRFEIISPLNNRIKKIYNFARDEIANVWDGKNDNVIKIIDNMNGGCTEHSYIQIAMLRSSGLAARFNWNCYPDREKQELNFNHKHAEVWFPESGWLPMEPLGSEIMAGLGAHYHLIFSVNSTLYNEYSNRSDRIANYTGDERWDLWDQAKIEVNWLRMAY